MRTNNVILIAAVAIILVAVCIFAGMNILNNPSNTTNDTNDTNNTLNESLNNTNESDNSTDVTTKTGQSKNTKSGESNIKSESIKENYQAGNGSHYREVEYKDGNFRQYDSNGKLIGSSYQSDQAKLKQQAGDSWPGD